MSTNNFEHTTPKSFKLRKLLGEGGFAKVFKVEKFNEEGKVETYAMKVTDKRKFICRSETNIGKNEMLERDILQSVEHPFVIKLYCSFQTESKIYLILEYGRYDLEKLLGTVVSLPDTSASFYIKQVVLAIEYLHSQGIAHRDIKPSNILIDAKGYIKLTDFGISKNNFMEGRTYSNCGTFHFMAPEVFEKVGYGKEVDWWAVGVLLCRMVTGMLPQFASGKYAGPAKFYGDIKTVTRNLLIKLLERNVKKRLGTRGADEIKQHLYFQNTNWEKLLNRDEIPPFVPKPKQNNIICKIFKKIFAKSISDSSASTVDEKDNDQFKGFSYTGDNENVK